MSQSIILDSLQESKKGGQKKFVVLVDPDKVDASRVRELAALGHAAEIDYFFIGGSLLMKQQFEDCISLLKKESDIPVIIFPGSTFQICDKADAFLLLSLISGRNPELLIGNQVIAAPYLRASGLEILPTGYMLIDGGKASSVSYISNTTPIPAEKDEIAICTAMAGNMLGLKLIYMDAGSGAIRPISVSMIKKVSKAIDVPLIIGGGIRTPEQAFKSAQAGADMIVVGNVLEKEPDLMKEMAAAVHSLNNIKEKV